MRGWFREVDHRMLLKSRCAVMVGSTPYFIEFAGGQSGVAVSMT